MSIRRDRPRRAGPAPGRSSAPRSPWKAPGGRQRERQLKREAVIRAAARAFSERGYHNTSLDHIAARLEVTKPTVYYYVESKEHLLFECFAAGVAPIRAACREARALPLPGRERLTVVLRRYGETVASELGWCMVRAEDLDLPPAMSGHIRRMKSQIDQDMRRLIRDGIADGSIGPCDPKMTAFALAGALNWIAHWYRDNQAMTGGEIAAAFVAIFEQGLLPRSATAARGRRASSLAGAPGSGATDPGATGRRA